MTKTFKELREATGNIIKRIMGPAEIRELKIFARQTSAAFASTIPNVLAKIEAKLNFFGYTLGELDLDEPFDNEAEETYLILVKNDSEIVKNVYLQCRWTKLASGQTNDWRPDGSALKYEIEIDVLEVSPEELQRMIDDIMLQDEPGEDGYILPEPVGKLPKPTTDDLDGNDSEDIINRAIKGDEEGGKPFGQDDQEDEEDDEENDRNRKVKESLDEGIDYKMAGEHEHMLVSHLRELKRHSKDPHKAAFHAGQVSYYAGKLAKHHEARADLHSND